MPVPVVETCRKQREAGPSREEDPHEMLSLLLFVVVNDLEVGIDHLVFATFGGLLFRR
jgi:hypothetical protein